jgi:hypothetical protein
MDLDRVAHGEDLVKTIEKAIESSDFLVVIIGKQWLSDLENLDDHVRLELAVVFKRNIRAGVIPMLAEGASMPRYDELPDDLKVLALLDALQVSDASFEADYRRLGSSLVALLFEQGRLGEALENRWKFPREMRIEKNMEFSEQMDKRLREIEKLLERPTPGLEGKHPEAERRERERLEAERGAPDSLAGILARGNFPKQAVHRAVNVPGEPERSPVDCTVFAPDRVERERTGLLQAFLHAPEARREAEAAARKFDPEATERGYRSLVLDAPIGTTFNFDVEIEGFVLPERTDRLLWTGQPQAATFRFDVPKGCKLGQHAGTVRISQDGAPVARITFQIEVVLDARKASQRPVGKEAAHYHACFCSYSSLDRAEMLKRAQGIRATGLETFIDVLTLRPGDMWNPKIFEAIDESDLFVVIWSTNARDSEWVKKELYYALRHYKEHGGPDFVPIPVEGPPIASVPQDLQDYHFNDELLGQIRAAELEMLARKKNKPEC